MFIRLPCYPMFLLALAIAAHAGEVWAVDTPSTTFAKTKPVMMSAPEISPTEPVTMEADSMGYDQNRHIVVAEGNVEVVQGDYILRADQLTFYQDDNLVRAEGHVSVLQPGGDVYFADHVELTGDMKSGVVRSFKARLADDSVFAANQAVRVDPATTKMKRAVYSPCKICEGTDPFWQVKARKVKVDNIDETITYRDATLEFAGVPVLYTPYFSHPTPNADAKSGFLVPEYSQSSNLGTMVRVPYYWRVAPDKELTLTPWYTSEGPLLQGLYEQLTDHGAYSLDFSGTYPDKLDNDGNKVGGNEFRGYVFAKGQENLSPYSRVGFDVQRSTDDTYLRRYGFGSQYSLTSRAYGESAENRNYVLAETMLFQGLRITDDSSTTPRILPSVSGYYETQPLTNGTRFYTSGNIENLARPVGSEYKRATAATGVKLPYVTDGGHVFEAGVEMRGDIYSVDDVSVDGGASTFDGSKTRALPQASLSWRYPLITQVSDASLTVEPIAVAVAQPNGGNPEEIPNEDNRVVELTDTNIFSTNRMPGYDTVDSGSRVAYGMRSQILFSQGQSVEGLLGQSYSTSETPFPNSRILGEEFSDYIGRVGLNYAPFSIAYRFALDQDTFEATRNEIWTSYANSRLQLTAAYMTIKKSPYVSDSEELLSVAAVKLAPEWRVYGNARRDILNDAMVSAAGGVIYENECFSLLTQLQRTYTRDRDIEPSTEVSLRVGFKNFGEFGNN